jgi:hypothetical protein
MIHHFLKKYLIIAIISFLAINSPCEANQDNNTHSGDFMKEIANEYYKQIQQINEKRIELNELDRKALSNEKAPVPTEATGKVLNIQGEAVENAEITISTEESDISLGKGKTDENGNFHIRLSQSDYRGLAIKVLKNSYRRTAFTGIYGGIVDYEVRLGREINESFLQELLNEKESKHKFWLLLEIIGSNDLIYPIDADSIIFPYLGSLRPLMLKMLKSNLFEKWDDKISSPANRIICYLHLWHEPSDQAIIEQVKSIRAHQKIQFVENVSAETIDEVCSRWADMHFKQEKVERRPPYSCLIDAIDPTGKHALATFSVMYAQWGYSYKLILVKEGNIWELKSAMKGRHWDMF